MGYGESIFAPCTQILVFKTPFTNFPHPRENRSTQTSFQPFSCPHSPASTNIVSPLQITLHSLVLRWQHDHRFELFGTKCHRKRLLRLKTIFLKVSQVKTISQKPKSFNFPMKFRHFIYLIAPHINPGCKSLCIHFPAKGLQKLASAFSIPRKDWQPPPFLQSEFF